MRSALILTILASPVLAETPMNAETFDTYVTGRTLSFGSLGDPNYGVEMYLPDRRVIWSGTPGICTNGVWYENEGDICFLYEDDPEPKCWAIYDEPGGMRAVFTTRPDTTVIFETVEDSVPLICDDLNS